MLDKARYRTACSWVRYLVVKMVRQIVASELKDPICHSDECQIGSFSSEATEWQIGSFSSEATKWLVEMIHHWSIIGWLYLVCWDASARGALRRVTAPWPTSCPITPPLLWLQEKCADPANTLQLRRWPTLNQFNVLCFRIIQTSFPASTWNTSSYNTRLFSPSLQLRQNRLVFMASI